MINPKPSCFAIKPGVAVKSDMVRHSSRTALWRSWGSLLSMIPCGGAAICGCGGACICGGADICGGACGVVAGAANNSETGSAAA